MRITCNQNVIITGVMRMPTFEGTGIKESEAAGRYLLLAAADPNGVQYSESLQTGDREEALKRMADKVGDCETRELV
jgi:hypothetical protein